MPIPGQKFIISKRIDPIFAIAVGLAAAGQRIRREELERGYDPKQTLQVLMRRFQLLTGL